jgi:hypothetical protein
LPQPDSITAAAKATKQKAPYVLFMAGI